MNVEKRKNNKAKVSLARDLEKQSNLSDYATGYHMVHCFFLRTYVWFARNFVQGNLIIYTVSVPMRFLYGPFGGRRVNLG